MLKMSDIASHAGVSPSTVSFVLNDRHESLRISEKTRQKVLQAAEELGYRSNQWARAMRTGNSRMLGLLGGKTSEEQVGRMQEGVVEAADAQGYTLKILRLDAFGDSAQQVIRRSSELRLMGMIALHLPDAVLAELHTEAQKFNTPLVLMDARCPQPDIPQVVSDDESGIALGVEHLVQLGHKKIAFLTAGSAFALGTLRNGAYKAAMARHGCEVSPEWIKDASFRFREPALQAARELLSLPEAKRPTAIFCSGDLMALATLQAANELGIAVPRELSVMGFANLTATEYATPQLTTIEQPFTEIGRTTVEVLLNLIGERSSEEPAPEAPKNGDSIRVLPTRLIQRASTAPPQ